MEERSRNRSWIWIHWSEVRIRVRTKMSRILNAALLCCRYPYLWPAVISLYSCGHFLAFSLYFHAIQFQALEADSLKKSN
jgi:hypothetical protein